MHRYAAALCALCALSSVSLSVRAQSRISGSVGGAIEYTNNAPLAPDGPQKTDDQVYSFTPSIQAQSETQGVDAFLRYTLQYWHYQRSSGLDRALHDLDAHADLTWWENVDLQLSEDLVPVPLDFGAPVDNPANDVQSSHTGGELSFKHDFNDHTHGTIGYQGEYVDWLMVHTGDTLPPGYVIHGPGIGITRDLDHVADVTLEYRYRMEHFTDSNAPPTGDVSFHSLALIPAYRPAEWVEIKLGIGAQAVSFANGNTATRTLLDGSVRMLGASGELRASYLQHLTTDILGNPADEKMALLESRYLPIDRWGFGVGGAWGDIHLLASGVNPYGERSFVEMNGTLFYELPTRGRSEIDILASHHQTLTSSGSLPQLDVDRISLGARVGFE